MDEQSYSKVFLDEMRHTGDPLADNTVQDIFERGEVGEVNRLLAQLIRDDQASPEGLPPEVQNYLNESAILPSWKNDDLIAQGEEMFRTHGLIAFSLLACASLPELYSCGDGVEVLWATQQLKEHVNRRMLETTQMVVDVMSKGGLQPEGRGIRTAQRVRLMHAAIRHLTLQKPGPDADKQEPKDLSEAYSNKSWDEEKFGRAISQEYMAGTLLTFSYVILRGMRQFEAKLTPEEENAYLHCWNVVGYIMGIDERLFANDMEEAERLYSRIMKRNRRGTPEGQALTRAILKYMEDRIRNSGAIFRVLPVSRVPLLLMQELVGRDTAILLGIKGGFLDQISHVFLRAIMKTLGRLRRRIYGNLSFSHMVAEWLFRMLADEIRKTNRGGNRAPFSIPEHLEQGWKLKPQR